MTERKLYLDNIRWSTVLLVMFYHVCYLFNDVGILGGIPGAKNIPFCGSFRCSSCSPASSCFSENWTEATGCGPSAAERPFR